MTNLLITGDWHISERLGLDDISKQLDIVSKYSHQADELILLGDEFDSKHPSSQEIAVFARFLSQVKIPVTIVVGNHNLIGIHLSSLNWIPFLYKINLHLKPFRRPIENIDCFMAHFNLKESKLGPNEISIQNLSIKNINEKLILLGHVHKSQVITHKDKICIHPGSLTYIDFGERNDSKGFYMITLNGNEVKYKFVPVNPIPMFQLRFNNSTTQEIVEKLKEIPNNSKVKIIVNFNEFETNLINTLEKIFRVYRTKHRVFNVELKPLTEYISKKHHEQQNSDTLDIIVEDFFREYKIEEQIQKKIKELLCI